MVLRGGGGGIAREREVCLLSWTHWKVPFHPHQTVLLPVVEPVASASSADQPLQLVGLHPYDLIHALIAPQSEALSAELHGPACAGGGW